MPEILLIILGIIGAAVGFVMQRLLRSLDDLDFVSEKNFQYRLNTPKAWFLWIVTLMFYINFQVWPYNVFNLYRSKCISLNPSAIDALGSLTLLLVTMLIAIFLNIVAVFGIFLFVRNLIAKTSPSLAWRAILLYLAISLCSITIVAIFISFVMRVVNKDNERNELQRKLNFALDPNREFFRAS